MIISTTMDVNGFKVVEYRGLVRGVIVRAPTIMQGLMTGLKNMVGGKIGALTTMCETARQQAYDLMLAHAQELGADAVIGVRYDASQVAGEKYTATEVLCYGTAVKLQKLSQQ